MALLCAHVDTEIIHLVGRWCSDEMLRYLHVQAELGCCQGWRQVM
jgi:hypothetical protein